MKIELNDLRNGIAIVSPAAAKSFTLPILTHIMLWAKGGELELAANNLEMAVATNVSAIADKEFGITVPAKLFTDYIAALGEGEVEISVNEKTMTLTVKADANEGTIKGMSPKDFPASPAVEGEVIEFMPADLLETIGMVAFAASRDESRFVLTGVLVNLSGQKMTMIAADGFRVSKYERTVVDLDEKINRQLLIPAKALNELAKIMQHHPEDVVKMKIGEDRSVFEIGPTILTCGLIDGTYPNVGQVIPDEDETTTAMTVNRKDFLGAVKTASVFAKYANEILVLEIGSGMVRVSGQSAEFGDNTGECDAEVEGHNLEIAINAKYLAEVLSIMKNDEVKFYFTTPSAPAMIKQGNFTHIIMPMHIST